MPIISKTVRLIIVLIVSAAAALLYFSYSYSWAGLVPLFASLGGEIVFVGLWIEKEAEEEDKKEHRSNFIGEKNRNILKSKLGWWILMVGILAEIAFGAALAIYDVSEAAKLETAVAWRTISPQQEAQLIAILKPFAQSHLAPKNTVVVQNSIVDSESDAFARRIYFVLNECGFDVDLQGVIPTAESPNIVGLTFSIRSPLNIPPQAEAIVDAFRSVGVIAADPNADGLGQDPTAESGILIIRVGHKPEK
jgi:hypothetical protein